MGSDMKIHWACASDAEPAGDKFIVENGQSRLWPRVRMEIDKEEHCAWNHVHRTDKGARIEDILDWHERPLSVPAAR